MSGLVSVVWLCDKMLTRWLFEKMLTRAQCVNVDSGPMWWAASAVWLCDNMLTWVQCDSVDQGTCDKVLTSVNVDSGPMSRAASAVWLSLVSPSAVSRWTEDRVVQRPTAASTQTWKLCWTSFGRNYTYSIVFEYFNKMSPLLQSRWRQLEVKPVSQHCTIYSEHCLHV